MTVKIPSPDSAVRKLGERREGLRAERLSLIHQVGSESRYEKRQRLGAEVRSLGSELDAVDAEYLERRAASGREGWEKLSAQKDYRAVVNEACASWAARLEALAALHIVHHRAGQNGIDVPRRRAGLPLLVLNELREFALFVQAQQPDLDALPPACREIVAGGLL